MGAGLVFLVLGGLLIFGPFFLPNQAAIPTSMRLGFLGAGIVFAVIGAFLIIITRLYRKASAEEAFVRTGMGGTKVIIDGGSLVVPVLHEVIPVSLSTMKLEIARRDKDALITGDKLRADVVSEFYIAVQPKTDDILAAARSLGTRSLEPARVTELVSEKLISALRSVAAKSTLDALNSEREKFATDVGNAVREELKQNGLTLETVTVSMLDQTDILHLKQENVFDAEGRKRIAEITSSNAIEENKFRKDAEQAIAEKNTKTTQAVTGQEVLQATARAERDAQIAIANASQAREAGVIKAQQEQLTETAKIEAAQTVGQREAEKDQAIRVAQVTADQAAATAEVGKDQAVEVAKRQKEVKVAQAETDRADAEALQLKAEQQKTVEAQGVITAEQTATAKREKEVLVITAQKDAEVKQTNENIDADITAYKTVTVAQGELDAANKKAEAITIGAKASKDASVLKAEGETAVQMVPVNVAAKQVEVDAQRQNEVEAARITNLTNELKAKGDYTEVSVQLEQAIKFIQAIEAIGVAQAEAVGKGLEKANMTLYGDPAMLNKFTDGFGSGLKANALINTLLGKDGQLGSLLSLAVPLAKMAMGGKEEGIIAKAGDLITKLQDIAGENPRVLTLIGQLQEAIKSPVAEPVSE